MRLAIRRISAGNEGMINSVSARALALGAGNIIMILGKFWNAIRGQLNKIANIFWEADPIAQMQYEHDAAVEQLKEGRKGLETYRGLVERVTRQVAGARDHVHQCGER